jgi:hypothetical protein
MAKDGNRENFRDRISKGFIAKLSNLVQRKTEKPRRFCGESLSRGEGVGERITWTLVLTPHKAKRQPNG